VLRTWRSASVVGESQWDTVETSTCTCVTRLPRNSTAPEGGDVFPAFEWWPHILELGARLKGPKTNSLAYLSLPKRSHYLFWDVSKLTNFERLHRRKYYFENGVNFFLNYEIKFYLVKFNFKIIQCATRFYELFYRRCERVRRALIGKIDESLRLESMHLWQ